VPAERKKLARRSTVGDKRYLHSLAAKCGWLRKKLATARYREEMCLEGGRKEDAQWHGGYCWRIMEEFELIERQIARLKARG